VLEGTANQHDPYKATITVVPGIVNTQEIFLPLETVSYQWSVVPSTLSDHYTVTLESTFATDVPIPVVTIDAPQQLPPLAPGQSSQIDVTLTNHGLIAAQNLQLILPNDPGYTYTTPSIMLGVLPAHSAITVPVLVTRDTGGAAAPDAGDATDSGGSRFSGFGSGSDTTALNGAPMAGNIQGPDLICYTVIGGSFDYECGLIPRHTVTYTGIQINPYCYSGESSNRQSTSLYVLIAVVEVGLMDLVAAAPDQ
jgi:hypothetical protein